MPSALQSLATVTVFDYLYGPDGKPLVNQEVLVQLAYSKATYINPVVSVPSVPVRVTTDSNGYWQASLIANTNLNPANTVYTVRAGGQSYDIAVPAGAGPFQASAIATGAIPALVGGFNEVGNGTISGNLTVTQSIVQQGTLTSVTALFVSSGQGLTFNSGVGAQIVPYGISRNQILFPSGPVFISRGGAVSPTVQWDEELILAADHAGSPHMQLSFMDTNAAPWHSWVMGLGLSAVDALEWATATGQSVKMRLNFDGSLELLGGLRGHVTTVGATPTVDLVNASITGVSIVGTDTAGTVTFSVTGATVVAQTVLMRVNFAVAYTQIPIVLPGAMTDVGTGGANGTVSPTNVLVGSFQVISPNAMTTLHTYTFSYHVIGR